MMLSKKEQFSESFSKSKSLPYLFRFLVTAREERSELQGFCESKSFRWSLFQNVVSNAAIKNGVMTTSGWVELLAVISECKGFSIHPTDREGAAKVLFTILSDSTTHEAYRKFRNNISSYIPFLSNQY